MSMRSGFGCSRAMLEARLWRLWVSVDNSIKRLTFVRRQFVFNLIGIYSRRLSLQCWSFYLRIVAAIDLFTSWKKNYKERRERLVYALLFVFFVYLRHDGPLLSFVRKWGYVRLSNACILPQIQVFGKC